MILNIAILIPVYNGLKYLQKSVPLIWEQINKTEGCKFELIVIDDNSSDGTSTWIQTNYTEIKLLIGTGSLWWSGAINLGLRYVLDRPYFDYVLLWNHDTVCDNKYFRNLVNVISWYDDKTIIASKIYFLSPPEIIFNMGAFFNPKTGRISLNGYGKIDSVEFNKPVQVDWTGGMGTLIPIGIFKNIGLFDQERFPQYYGDCDFFLRAKEQGYRLFVVPDLKIWNDKSNSGLVHNAKWSSFIHSLYSIKSNQNVFIEYKFLRRHSRSVFVFLYFIIKKVLYFFSFIKHWMKASFFNYAKH